MLNFLYYRLCGKYDITNDDYIFQSLGDLN